MAQSASSGLVNTGALTADLQNQHTAEEMKGKLEAVLAVTFGTADAAEYAERLVDNGKFDKSAMLADLTESDLASGALDIPQGHGKALMRAVFSGVSPQPVRCAPKGCRDSICCMFPACPPGRIHFF